MGWRAGRVPGQTIDLSHQELRDLAAAWLMGGLDSAEAQRFALHLGGCDECYATVVQLSDALAALPVDDEP